MSMKPVFEKIAKIKVLNYVELCRHTMVGYAVLSTPALTVTIIDKIAI